LVQGVPKDGSVTATFYRNFRFNRVRPPLEGFISIHSSEIAVREVLPISVSQEAEDERAYYPGEKPFDVRAGLLFLLRMARRY
jgi:hypothetical protein